MRRKQRQGVLLLVGRVGGLTACFALPVLAAALSTSLILSGAVLGIMCTLGVISGRALIGERREPR